MLGRLSTFGGIADDGMKHEEGLALYEHHEADLRPDLFHIRSLDHTLGTSKRLKDNALYFAYRYDQKQPRAWLQRLQFIFTNPRNGLSVVLHLVDWGPHISTEREYDISPYAATLLRVQTDDQISGEPY